MPRIRLFQKKVRGEKIRVIKKRDGQNRHPTKFGYRIKKKRKKENIKINKYIYPRMKSKHKV